MTAHQSSTTVVGVFADQSTAQRAVQELKRAGFRDDQIGVAGRGGDFGPDTGDLLDHSSTGDGAVAGAAAGAGLGALWGLGIMAGVMPALGPAIAGGTLAAILSSAAAGAAAAGIGGALIGLGIPHDDADYYEGEFRSGRTIVSVSAGDRADEARSLLRQLGGYDSQTTRPAPAETAAQPGDHMAGASFSSTQSQTGQVETGHRTLDVPVQSNDVLTGRDPIAESNRKG